MMKKISIRDTIGVKDTTLCKCGKVGKHVRTIRCTKRVE
jgi:hypothetical protein